MPSGAWCWGLKEPIVCISATVFSRVIFSLTSLSLPLSLYILSPLVEERMGDALMTKAFSPQKKNLLGEVVKTVFEFFE